MKGIGLEMASKPVENGSGRVNEAASSDLAAEKRTYASAAKLRAMGISAAC